MPLARRSRVVETWGASPADVVGSWRGLSPSQRLTLEPVPVGTPGCRLFERESQTLNVHAGSAGRRPVVMVREGTHGGDHFYERVAGIDVGKKIIAVAVRTPGARAG